MVALELAVKIFLADQRAAVIKKRREFLMRIAGLALTRFDFGVAGKGGEGGGK